MVAPRPEASPNEEEVEMELFTPGAAKKARLIPEAGGPELSEEGTQAILSAHGPMGPSLSAVLAFRRVQAGTQDVQTIMKMSQLTPHVPAVRSMSGFTTTLYVLT